MIGAVIVGHGKISKEMLAVLNDICGKQEQMTTMSIDHNDDLNGRRSDITKKIKSVESGNGVIVFTDMFGGTPSNLALSIAGKESIEVIAGVNLPMLIEFHKQRQENLSLSEVAKNIYEAGRKHIQLASALLGRECA